MRLGREAAGKNTRRKPWEIVDGLWERIEPLLPVVKRRYRYPGRKRLDDRAVLCGILFVLYTGIRWEFLPQELGFGSGMTCWRRLRDWHEAGVWQKTSCCWQSCAPPAGWTSAALRPAPRISGR